MGSIVSFSISKISAERKNENIGKVNITNNISIKDVSDTKFAIGSSNQSGVKFSFVFATKYEPEAAEMLLEGNVLYMTEDSDAKKILSTWKKDKTIDTALTEAILNYVLDRCNIEALILSKEMNLPAPFPMPKVRTQEKAQDKAPEKTVKTEKVQKK